VGRGREVELPFVSKAPFANYDLIVYFGGGLFAILIFWKYIALPLHIFDFSNIAASTSLSLVQDVTYLLILGVCAYVLGHLVSYQSSYFIEGFIERTLGKFSKLIEITTVDASKRSKKLKNEIWTNTKDRLFFRSRIPFVNRTVPIPWFLPTFFHLPVMPWYAFVLLSNLFDFADTRLPSRMVTRVKSEVIRCFPEVGTQDRQWFRWVEYYTAYNRPVAAASMYNYLVIFGLMRSLSYLFLLAIWLQIAHLAWAYYSGQSLISHGPNGAIGWALYFLVLYVAYITTVTSYCKFFRRYIEEAIMGFLLEDYPLPSDAP
jgi:hypothetical protein